MKSLVKQIYKENYKKEEIPIELEKTFSCNYTQRYFPGIELLKQNKAIPDQSSGLRTKYIVKEWRENIGKNTWKIIRLDTQTNDTIETCSFVKTTHLLNPVKLIKYEYSTPKHALLPQCENAWKTTIQKLHSKNNQAYVDTVANYICSRIRENDIMPNFVLQYGSMVGISEKYRFCISDEFQTYRMCEWFWRGIKTQKVDLKIFSENEDVTGKILDNTVFQYPFMDKNNETVIELETKSKNSTDKSLGPCSVSTFNPNDIDYIKEDDQLSVQSENSRYSSSEDSESADEYDIFIEIPDMPVIMTFQEEHVGTMDSLLESEEIDGVLKNSKKWEDRWKAWIFQITCTLTFLQKNLSMTHNDLHTNNIVWRKTDDKYLYYGSNDGTIWRVPTYGKIFSIIDFGRAIFQFKKQMWISDDFYAENDASEQYNFGPFMDKTKKRVGPNPSFDLCRLAVSMIDGLFNIKPRKKKGTRVVLSNEGSYKIMETISPLFNLLWSWTVDDNGKTVYETQDGDEKYDGFDLYIQIARNVHGAVPEEQLRRPLFEKYVYKKKKIPSKVYIIG